MSWWYGDYQERRGLVRPYALSCETVGVVLQGAGFSSENDLLDL